MSISVIQPGSLQAANTSTSVPEGSEIYALSAADDPAPQAPRRIWSGKDEVVYALAPRPDGLIALSGNRGRIFRIGNDGSYADVAHLEAQQGLSLATVSGTGDGGSMIIGTGNTGKLVRLGNVANHEYASDVLDAGVLARFGAWRLSPAPQGSTCLPGPGTWNNRCAAGPIGRL